MNKLFKVVLSLPKTLWFNIRIFGFKKGIRCPILIGYNMIIKEIHKGCIIIPDKVESGMIKIGINHGTDGILEGNLKSFIKVSKESKIIFKGNADLKDGISLIATYGGRIIVGDKFSCNRGCCISSDNIIEIGEDVMFGWNVHIRTSDGHPIYDVKNLNQIINENKPVLIGKHVWIASDTNILKGALVPDFCIVGFGSCITNAFSERNSIIAGCPAKIVKFGIHWER